MNNSMCISFSRKTLLSEPVMSFKHLALGSFIHHTCMRRDYEVPGMILL